MSRELAVHIINTLESNFHSAYMVGGCVRDQLLGVEPHDWDVCTSARPDTIQAIFPDTKLVGAKFGVCLVSMGFAQVEVATYRSEGAYSDGRRPDEVKFENDPMEDVKRRDFTVNGMLMDADGRILDYVGGREDLELQLIRCIGDPETRFQEDYLRILRAIRFCGQLPGWFILADDTQRALIKCRSRVQDMAPERVAGEFNRMLTGPDPRKCFEIFMSSGVLEQVYPVFGRMPGCEQNPVYHPEGDVWVHTLKLLAGNYYHAQADRRGPRSLALMLACLFHDIGKPETYSVNTYGQIQFLTHEHASVTKLYDFCGEYHYPIQVRDDACWLVENHMRIGRMDGMKRSKQMRLMQNPLFLDLLELHRLDCAGSNRDMTSYSFARNLFETTPEETVKPKALLDGHAVMELLGIRPGPLVGHILRDVQERQLEGEITTVAEAEELARLLYVHNA